jgi:hypothetical protein
MTYGLLLIAAIGALFAYKMHQQAK